MKSIQEILKTPRLQIVKTGGDGGICYAHLASSKKPHPAAVIFSNGGGWDHVSVSFSNRTPTWEEMAEVKKLFFKPDEVAFELHPIESEYVNNMPYCLHIWRHQQQPIPTPPSWMVGVKNGQTLQQAIKQGLNELDKGGSSAGDRSKHSDHQGARKVDGIWSM
jgi:hypothetical protein